MTAARTEDIPKEQCDAVASDGFGEYYGEGSVMLTRDGWFAVMGVLEGDDTQRDDAFDALQRWAPSSWLAVLDEDVDYP